MPVPPRRPQWRPRLPTRRKPLRLLLSTRLLIRVYPDKPITKKPLEVRQGSGKGPVEAWVCVIRPGRVIYEIAGVTEEQAKEAMRLAAQKLPMPTRFVAKAD